MEAAKQHVTDGSPPKFIDQAQFARIDDSLKPGFIGAIHASFLNHTKLSEAMQTARLLGYEQAEKDGRSPWDVVVVLAHNDAREMFFKDHPKLTPEQRERMIEAFSIEETAAHQALMNAEAREKLSDVIPEKSAMVTRLEFERDWATARWQWKRYAGNFSEYTVPDTQQKRDENGQFLPLDPDATITKRAEWAAWWVYRQDLETDPIYLDAKHPWHPTWVDMTKLVEAMDGVKFLVIWGNCVSAQIGVFAKEKADATAATKTADEHMEELRTGVAAPKPAPALAVRLGEWIPQEPEKL